MLGGGSHWQLTVGMNLVSSHDAFWIFMILEYKNLSFLHSDNKKNRECLRQGD